VQLELEVTESTLVQDTDKFIATLCAAFKATPASERPIDDFGTGYSNPALTCSAFR